jgi:hypothetical protein
VRVVTEPEGVGRIAQGRRGPEYLTNNQKVTISEGQRQIVVQLTRWIDPSRWGWYSGDTHIHAGGCAHYDNPTEGVSPETMIRHVRGEALSIGDVLSWGPSWYYQKQFFSGRAISPSASLEHPELQAAADASLQPKPTSKDSESLLRYDVEVSGFPSSVHGHLVLLRLREQDYPGTKLIQEWPSWNLPILKWARQQGAVAGYAHCGYRLPMLGETDFPCISGERVGTARSYVRLDHRPIGGSGYEARIQSLKRGRLYCGDGRSHFLEFKVHERTSGDEGVALRAPGAIEIEALVAARLDAGQADPGIQAKRPMVP